MMAKSSHLFVLAILCLGVTSAMILDDVREDSTEEVDSIEGTEDTTLEEEDHTEDDMDIDSTVRLDHDPTTDSSVTTDAVPTTNTILEKKTQGPSRPATPKPGCSSYVSCPWVYPQPVSTESSNIDGSSTASVIETEGSENTADSSSQTPVSSTFEASDLENPATQVALVEYFGSSENNETVPSETDNSEAPPNAGNRPSISATPKPQYPSFVPGPWIYPRPIGEQPISYGTYPVPGFGDLVPKRPPGFAIQFWPRPFPQLFPIDSPTIKTVNDEQSSVGDESTTTVQQSSAEQNPTSDEDFKLNTRIDDQTTQIPDCPLFASCPSIYPVPITDEPSVDPTSKEPSSEEQDSIDDSSNDKPSSNTNILNSVSLQSSNRPSIENDIYGILSGDLDDGDLSDTIFFEDPIVERKKELARAKAILEAMLYGNSPFSYRRKNTPSIVII